MTIIYFWLYQSNLLCLITVAPMGLKHTQSVNKNRFLRGNSGHQITPSESKLRFESLQKPLLIYFILIITDQFKATWYRL